VALTVEAAITCSVRNAFSWNRKELQNSNPLCLNEILLKILDHTSKNN